ncbi:MAG: flavin-containing monooxygenase [Acidimicrobiales bacterium]
MEHVDVLIAGAGLSGIGAADHLERRCPWATYAILEARRSLGGTWDLFRYPGVRSDSDVFTLGYALRPWEGEKAIAEGDAILDYIAATATERGIDRRIRFQHRIVRADWSSSEARWHVVAERVDTGATVEFTCGFFFSCTGYYRYDRGYRPDLPGLDRFGGPVVHPQFWPADLDYAGRRVVVVGSGATAVTLVPALARTAAHVTMLQRSPTYIASLPARDPVAGVLRRWLPAAVAGPALRWINALTAQAFYQVCRRRPAMMKRFLRRRVAAALPAGYDVDTHFQPTYDPWDQRLCLAPDGDLFRAIGDGTASVVTDHIEEVIETGIRLRSGAVVEADVLVTATGLELLFLGGIALTVDGEPVDLPGCLLYKGMMLDGVPNFAVAFGYANASWTLKCDLTSEYVCRLLTHMRATGASRCRPVNHDDTMDRRAVLGLTSGYVQRAADRFPTQGSRAPWQVHQSYLKDYRTIKRGTVADEALELSNPERSAKGPVLVSGQMPTPG